MDKKDRIFVAGHKGLVGSAILRKLNKLGYENILFEDRSNLDLMNNNLVNDYFGDMNINYVFDAAARVGGIHANDKYCGDFIYENTLIQTNLIHASGINKIKKFIFLGSVCIYPKYADTPVKEESFLKGELEPTNQAYAIAKIHGIHMLKAYNKQHGLKGVSLMPANLYGPFDNFHPQNGHVIPALMHKFYNNNETVICWGDGTARREFLYVDDLADACIFASKHFSDAELINVGSGNEVTIRELVEILKKITGFNGKVKWDSSKPNGTPKRPLDYSKLKKLGWAPKYDLNTGLVEAFKWYKDNIAEVQRKINT